jgi:hypothetical protein
MFIYTGKVQSDRARAKTAHRHQIQPQLQSTDGVVSEQDA